MSKQEHCPVCGKAKETNTYSCGGCGFPLAFVTKFSDKESYDLWSEQVKNEKQKLTNKKRKNLDARFRAAGGCTAYLQDQQLYLVHSNGDFQKEEGVQAFSASERNYAVLYTDGSVKIFGEDNGYGQKNTDSWKDIINILAAPNCTYGITASGEIVAAGSVRQDVLKWKNMKQLCAGKHSIIGLDNDGTVRAGSCEPAVQEQLNKWSKITEIAVSGDCITGVKEDGSVCFCGKENDTRREVENWEDIVALTGDNVFFYGLTASGETKAAGSCAAFLDRGRSQVSQWSEQNQILALAGSPSGSIAAITETGDLLVAGSFKGDPDKIRECWKEHIKPVIMEAS